VWRLLDNNLPEQVNELVETAFKVMFIAFMLFTPLFFIILSRNDYQYVDYLKSNYGEKPTIRGACSSIFDVPKGFNFGKLKEKIAVKLWITYSDDVGLIKGRTKWHPFKQSTVAGAWLKYDSNCEKIELECFPLYGIQYNSIAKKIQKEIEECINDIIIN